MASLRSSRSRSLTGSSTESPSSGEQTEEGTPGSTGQARTGSPRSASWSQPSSQPGQLQQQPTANSSLKPTQGKPARKTWTRRERWNTHPTVKRTPKTNPWPAMPAPKRPRPTIPELKKLGCNSLLNRTRAKPSEEPGPGPLGKKSPVPPPTVAPSSPVPTPTDNSATTTAPLWQVPCEAKETSPPAASPQQQCQAQPLNLSQGAPRASTWPTSGSRSERSACASATSAPLECQHPKKCLLKRMMPGVGIPNHQPSPRMMTTYPAHQSHFGMAYHPATAGQPAQGDASLGAPTGHQAPGAGTPSHMTGRFAGFEGHQAQPQGQGGHQAQPQGQGGHQAQPQGQGGHQAQPQGQGGHRAHPQGQGGHQAQLQGHQRGSGGHQAHLAGHHQGQGGLPVHHAGHHPGQQGLQAQAQGHHQGPAGLLHGQPGNTLQPAGGQGVAAFHVSPGGPGCPRAQHQAAWQVPLPSVVPAHHHEWRWSPERGRTLLMDQAGTLLIRFAASPADVAEAFWRTGGTNGTHLLVAAAQAAAAHGRQTQAPGPMRLGEPRGTR